MNIAGVVHINKTGVFILTVLFLLLFYYIYIKDDESVFAEKTTINLKTLLSAAIAAAQQGGMEVVAYKDSMIIRSKGKTKEGANDSVTNADFKSHCVMMSVLTTAFPSVNVISEETVTNCDKGANTKYFYSENVVDDFLVPAEEVTVWIDPLDATQEYTEGLTEYVTTMVCVAVKGSPVIGVIHKPFANETFWALSRSETSFTSKNLRREQGNSEKVRMIVSRSHAGKVKEMIEKSKFSDTKNDIRPAGGAGYKVMELVQGKADVYIHVTRIKKWDICAGNAILTGLSGKMTDLKGNKIDYGSFSNPVLENGVLASIVNHQMYQERLIQN